VFNIKVLSLFDGMACGMLAMIGVGISVESYHAYEIDKYAVQTATHNFPQIVECGDVFEADFSKYKDIDFLIGGSPCTYWSIAQKNNRETKASGLGWELFSQYAKALREVKPKYFIYENNKSMSKAIRESITKTFGFDAICINSALVSAQNRQRLYWVGKRNEDGTYSKVDVQQPEDRGILLKDILDGAVDLTSNDKAWTLTASYQFGVPAWNTIERHQRNMAVEPVDMSNQPIGETKDGKSYCLTAGYSNGSGENIGNYAAHTLEKGCKSMVAEPVNTTPNGKSQTVKAQVQQTSIANIVKYKSTYGASGVAEMVDTSRQVGALPRPNGELSTSQAFRVYDTNAKSVTLKAGGGGAGGKTGLYAIPIEFENGIPTKAISSSDGKTYTVYSVVNGIIVIKGKEYPIKLQDGYYIIRKLSVNECKRLQTVPEWYEFPVSNAQAYKMLGNGWTVDVITHLIKSCLK
jgi:DNA (cytosine-5)-methyltransferase 3A